jgi:xanthine dehydrogenase small subunit
MSGCIEFVLNGAPRRLPAGTRPGQTLLEWLRGPEARLTGTKEGCAEGDCGACTVVAEELDGTRTPLNACLALLGQMHGRAFRTVEGLRASDGGPHPVQQVMARADATQCGFCTPGIVMSAWAHPRASEGASESGAHEALAGNLCRCTGYRPILEALAQVEDDGVPSPAAIGGIAGRFSAEGQDFHLPVDLPGLLALRAALPGAWLLAGGTDLGLRVSEHREVPPAILCLSAVPELQGVEASAEGLRIGAAAPYGRLLKALEGEADFAPLAALLRRLGSRQIRGMGTLGGNLGTASPIGDALPPLLALGAGIVLASAARGERVVPAAAFFTGYRQTLLAPDEIITRIDLPRPPPGSILACEKLSKRHDQDISALSAAFLLRVEAGRIAEARLAFGGMAATPARAPRAEAALTGAPLEEASFAAAAKALAQDFTPLSDWRASAGYRQAGAAGLLRRLYWRATRPDLLLEVHAP